MNVISIILLVLAGLPLIIYPAVFIAGVMGLAAKDSGSEVSLILIIISKLFLLSSLLYPVVYVYAGKLVKKAAAESDANEILYAAIPCGYLLMLCILYWVWSKLG